MKKLISLLLALCLLLCACSGAADRTEPTTEPTAAPTTEATTEPTTEPTTLPPPVYHNPLTGEEVDQPFTNRIFAVVINNLFEAMPHYGVHQADVYMEMFVNYSIIRGLALYSDIRNVESIGSVRSTRLIFTDILPHFDAIIAHAGGDNQVLTDAAAQGIQDFNIDTWDQTDYSFRDKQRNRKIGWEHCLFAKGQGIYDLAAEKGYPLTQPEDKDYGLLFAEDGTPVGGEDAHKITIGFAYKNTKKQTVMNYDFALGKYVYNQYGLELTDGITGQKEAFENVVMMVADITREGRGFYEANFEAGGTGWYACDGKIIPMVWTCEGADAPFRFFTEDGSPLHFGVGSTYMAVCHSDSTIAWEAAEPPAAEAATEDPAAAE